MLHRHERLNFPGSVHFVTTVTRIRGEWFVKDDVCREILRVFEQYRAKHGIVCVGYVLMPDHLHALLVQPIDDSAVSRMMGLFKSYSSRRIPIPSYPDRMLWRDYFDDVPVPGPAAAFTKLNYLHQNPVRRGLVQGEGEYLWSSSRDYSELERSTVTVTRIDAIAGLETHNGGA